MAADGEGGLCIRRVAQTGDSIRRSGRRASRGTEGRGLRGASRGADGRGGGARRATGGLFRLDAIFDLLSSLFPFRSQVYNGSGILQHKDNITKSF